MTFSELKVALRNHKENERHCYKKGAADGNGVMLASNANQKTSKFRGKCFKCGRKGHKSSDSCANKSVDRWCQRCQNKTHNSKDCRRKADAAKTAAELQREKEHLKSNTAEHLPNICY